LGRATHATSHAGPEDRKSRVLVGSAHFVVIGFVPGISSASADCQVVRLFGENYSGISKSLPARSYAWSINRTARAQSCTLIGGGAPRCQWSSASRTAMK
jgi:hypothetical protein